MLYVIGYPDDCGGANVELFATVKLWLAHGVAVTLIPTWTASDEWLLRVSATGAKTILCKPRQVAYQIPAGSTVISFGNQHFLDCAAALKERGCRLIYVPCEAEPSERDREFLGGEHLIDYFVFQSFFQYQAWKHLMWDYPPHPIIPGAFDPADFPFNPLPHKPGEPFVCGRISRPDVKKFSPDLWDAYRGVPRIRARIMGWSGTIEAHCGKPPEWATVLRKRSEPAREFYAKLHAIIHPGGEAAENWPRFVLEAMAAGVPVITDNRGGTREMIEDNVTGCLCDSTAEMFHRAHHMQSCERYRLSILSKARASLAKLSDPEAIWAKWEPLIGGK
jgi:hypothetical protein